MRWFKHDTDARNDVRIKLLKKKFGAEGYAVYFQLLEIIGEYVENDNIKEWGMVDKFHSIETLSEECGVKPENMRKILVYCNELGIFEKKDNRLYCEKITKRLDDYAGRVQRKSKTEQNTDIVRTKSEERKPMDTKGKPSSIGSILSHTNLVKPKSTGISTFWQDKAFREMEYLGIKLEKKDIGRVLKVYKEEAEGNKHKAMIARVVSYLKDYPTTLNYEGKLNMFFKLLMNGFERG